MSQHRATDALFAKARRLDAPDAGARDRMRRAVLERAAMAGAGVATTTIATSLSAPATKAATWSAALVAKIVVPLLLVGTAVTGAVTLSVPPMSAAPSFESPSRAAMSPLQERAGDRAPRAVVHLDVAPVVTSHAPVVKTPKTGAPAIKDDLDAASRADLRDLQEVERLLARGQAESALALLDARARGARSVFSEELEGARVLALCASTRSDEAARARSTFSTRYPVSPLARRIDRACATSDK